MTRSLPRWVHRNPPRAAPPDSWRSLRSARVPPMHYLDKPHRPSLAAIEWVRIRSAKRTKLGQNSTGVDKPSTRAAAAPLTVAHIGYWNLPTTGLTYAQERRLVELYAPSRTT
jgi:hypothetical protein